MAFKWYGRHDGSLSLSSTLHAMLTETGEHLFKLAFEKAPETTRNFIFGILVTPAAQVPVVDEWAVDASTKQCVCLCYELCEAFPLFEGSTEFVRLRKKIERILDAEVRLLPVTYFERSIGQYKTLHAIFNDSWYSGVFRHEAGSLLDNKMHVVLSRWQGATFVCTPEYRAQPCDDAAQKAPPATVAGLQNGEWNACFRSIASVLWYHAYVYEIIGEEVLNGYSLCNVMRTHDAVCAKGGDGVDGKLALLDVLKLVYRYNYSTA